MDVRTWPSRLARTNKPRLSAILVSPVRNYVACSLVRQHVLGRAVVSIINNMHAEYERQATMK